MVHLINHFVCKEQKSASLSVGKSKCAVDKYAVCCKCMTMNRVRGQCRVQTGNTSTCQQLVVGKVRTFIPAEWTSHGGRMHPFCSSTCGGTYAWQSIKDCLGGMFLEYSDGLCPQTHVRLVVPPHAPVI